MSGGIDWATVLKTFSIVATGLFGALGLSTEFKNKDTGRVTKWGKLALGGIVVTAALSLALLKQEAETEAKKQADQAKQAALQAEAARDSAEATSAALAKLMRAAQDNLDRQTEGARRDSENTLGVLRSIWNESNRVDASHISVAVTYTFLAEYRKEPRPLLQHAQLTLHATSQASERRLLRLDAWSDHHLLAGRVLAVTAREQRTVRNQYVSTDGPSFSQTSYFTGFEGEVAELADLSRWNGALVEVLLTEGHSSLVTDLAADLIWPEEARRSQPTNEPLRGYASPTAGEEAVPDYSVMPLPVGARMTLYVKDRPVATSEAHLVKTSQHDEDVEQPIVAKFPIVRVSGDTLPRFRPTR
jgi:hypothetical protein